MREEIDRPGILFVSTARVREPLGTSARKRWRGLAEHFRVHAVCFSPDRLRPFERAGCRFYPLPASAPLPVRILLYYLVVPWIALRLILSDEVRVLIAQSPYEAAAALVPRWITAPRGCRLIVEAHGDWIESFFRLRSLPDTPVLRRTLEAYSRFVFRRADASRSISPFTRSLVQRHAPPEQPHHTFPTYTDLEPFLAAADSPRVPEEPPILLYAGAMTELKGVKVLEEAYRSLADSFPELELWMYGKGPLVESLRGRLEAEGLGDRVRFPGHVETRRLRDAIRRARALVLPSYTEGLGRVLLEAMACGTPVIACDLGGPRDLIDASGGGLLVPAGDSRALADAVASLLEDPDRAAVLGQRGHQYVVDHFEDDWFFQGYRKLVLDVLDDPHGTSCP